MKYILSFFIIAIITFISTYFLLNLWGINMLSEEHFLKVLLSLGIISLTSFLLIVFVIVPVFMKSNQNDYDKNQKGIAQKKINNNELKRQ